MHTSPSSAGQRGAALTLLALETLPCGCVAGIYQSSPTGMEVEFLEAKGHYCTFPEHAVGQVTGLGMRDEMVSDDIEPLA